MLGQLRLFHAVIGSSYTSSQCRNEHRQEKNTLHFYKWEFWLIGFFVRNRYPDIGAKVNSTIGEAVVAVTVISRLGGTQGGITLAYCIAFIAQAVVKNVVIANSEEMRITIPNAVDEVGSIPAPIPEQTVPQIDIEVIKCIIVDFIGEATNDAVVEVGPDATVLIIIYDDGQRGDLEQVIVGKSTLTCLHLATRKVGYRNGRIADFGANKLNIAVLCHQTRRCRIRQDTINQFERTLRRVTISTTVHTDGTALHDDMLEHIIHRWRRKNDTAPLA